MADWTPPPFGSICWIEIPAVDVQELKKFYAALFPNWQWRPASEKYPEEETAMFTFSEEKDSLSGGIKKVKKAGQPQENGVGLTVYHLVESIDKTTAIAKSLGAEILSGKEAEGESGFYTLIRDVAGNRFGIYEFVISS